MLPWQSFVKECLGKIFSCSLKNALFSLETYSYGFFVQIQDQRQKIDSCAKFQPYWTKDTGARILTLNDTENCLMTSYLSQRNEVSKIFIAFERFWHRSNFGGNWATNKEETEGAQCVPPRLYFTKIAQHE